MQSLERTGGQEDGGVVGFKAELLESVVERLGHFEKERFYLIATLLDPRYLCKKGIICML